MAMENSCNFRSTTGNKHEHIDIISHMCLAGFQAAKRQMQLQFPATLLHAIACGVSWLPFQLQYSSWINLIYWLPLAASSWFDEARMTFPHDDRLKTAAVTILEEVLRLSSAVHVLNPSLKCGAASLFAIHDSWLQLCRASKQACIIWRVHYRYPSYRLRTPLALHDAVWY